MKSTKPFWLSSFLLALVLITFSACSMMGYEKTYFDSSFKRLSKDIEVFNSEFETKSIVAANLLVVPEKREEFMIKMLEIEKKVTFDRTTLINIEFFQDGTLRRSKNYIPEESFNEAVLTKRYDVIVLPVNKLRTVIVKQKWKREGLEKDAEWYVQPDLDAFLNPAPK